MSHLLKLKFIPAVILVFGLISIFTIKPALAYTTDDYNNLVASMSTAQKQEVINLYNSVPNNSTITVTELKSKVDGLSTFNSTTKSIIKDRIDIVSHDTGKTTFSKGDVNTAFGSLTGSSSPTNSTSDTAAANSFNEITPEVVIAQLVTVVFIFVAMIVWLMVDIVLVGRWVMLAFLAILSPLPFILMILPATKKYAQMWWSKFVKWATVGVLITFFLWLVPQVLATKNDKGYWEKKTIEAWSGPTAGFSNWLHTGEYDDTSKLSVIYPKFLGMGGNAGDFFETFVMFCLGIGFMIAGAWTAVTLGETAGKIALGIPRFLKNTAKGAGKLAWKGTGIPGAAKQRWADVMGKRQALAEARKEKLMGGRTLGDKLVGEGLKNLKEKGVKAEDALGFAGRGYGANGGKLNDFDRVANYIHGASAIKDYNELQAAENHMRRLGASEKSITQFGAAVRDGNPLALYNLSGIDNRGNINPAKGEEEYERLEKDYKANPELFHRLLSKQKSISGGVLSMIGRVGGKKAIEDLIKPHNENNIMGEIQTMIGDSHDNENVEVSDGVREVYAKKKGNLTLAFSKKMFTEDKTPTLMTHQAAKFLNTLPTNDLAGLQFSPHVINKTKHFLNAATIRRLRYAARGEVADDYIKRIRTDFDRERGVIADMKGEPETEVANEELRDHILKNTPYKNADLVDYVLNHYYQT